MAKSCRVELRSITILSWAGSVPRPWGLQEPMVIWGQLFIGWFVLCTGQGQQWQLALSRFCMIEADVTWLVQTEEWHGGQWLWLRLSRVICCWALRSYPSTLWWIHALHLLENVARDGNWPAPSSWILPCEGWLAQWWVSWKQRVGPLQKRHQHRLALWSNLNI